MEDNMIGSGTSMRARRKLARASAVVFVMLAVLALGCTAVAAAAPPTITIARPETSSFTNDQTPPFGGITSDTVDPVVLDVYEGTSAGGTLVQTRTLLAPTETGPGEAAWELTPESPLAPGQYTAVARQTNTALETGESAPVTFTIDTTPPGVSINTLASPRNDPTPKLSGGAGVEAGDEPTIVVTVYEGSSVEGTIAASGSVTPVADAWSYTTPHLSDGTYTAQASQRDEAGNLGKSTPMTFTIDTTPPAVSMSALPIPLDSSEPTLSGAAGVAEGDSATVTVTIHEGATVAGKLVATAGVFASAGTWSFKAPHLADGTYTAEATQSDDAGNTGVSAPVTFKTPPLVSIEPVPTPTNDPEPTLTGAAGVAAGDQETVTVKVYEGESTAGKPMPTAIVSESDGKWSYQLPHLADGTYTAQASQTDDTGNVGMSAAATFRVDTTPPLVSINTVPTPSKDAEPTLSGGAGVALGDQPSVTVKIYAGESPGGKLVSSQPVSAVAGTWSDKAPHLADGVYTAQASQSDEAGNIGVSAAVTFAVDTVAPVVSLTSPAKDVVLNGSRPTFSGAAGEKPGDDPSITLKIYRGSTASGSLAVPEEAIKREGDHWTTGSAGPALPNGVYTAIAEQADDAGNIGTSAPVTFTIATVVTLDTSRFVQRVTGLFTGPTPSFDGTAGTVGGDGESVSVAIYEGEAATGTPVVSLESKLSGSGAWTVGPVPALADGTYTVQAEQEDSGVQYVVEATFSVDATAPHLTLSSPANGSSTSSSTQSLGGSAGIEEGDLPTITVQLYAGPTSAGTALQTDTAQATGGTWSSAGFAGLSSGTYTAQAEQSDDVGNVGHSEPVTFTVTTPPVSTVPAAASSPPVASFRWVPSTPHPGEPVTLVSTSTDASSPITAFAWALAGNGAFTGGEAAITTSFATAGAHVVQLQVTDSNGLTSTVAETIVVSAPAPSLIVPFPIVRMAGSYNAVGAKISLLTVQAPVGATVTVKCRGIGCPARSEKVVVASGAKSKPGTVLITLRRFERPLHAGAVLVIEVSYGGEIGKYTRFVIHHGKLPTRQDLCLSPGATAPIQCPS
jgi:large repetitive protein